MADGQLFSVLRERAGWIILIGLLFGALGFAGLVVFSKPFQSRTDFLVVQTNGQNVDYYTQFKSSEYLSRVLSEAILSGSFITAMVDTGKVNSEFLPFDQSSRLEAWGKMVHVDKNLELGIISVTVTGDSSQQVSAIMNALSEVLTRKNSLFRGGDANAVDIRVLSGPLTERSPKISLIVETTVASLFAGMFFVILIFVVRSERGRSEIQFAEKGVEPSFR